MLSQQATGSGSGCGGSNGEAMSYRLHRDNVLQLVANGSDSKTVTEEKKILASRAGPWRPSRRPFEVNGVCHYILKILI